MLHSRRERDGGPFYTLACPHCQARLVAEGGPREYRFTQERDLPKGSRVRRALRFFLGMPPRLGAHAARILRWGVPRLRPPAPSPPPPGERLREPLSVLGLAVDVSLDEVKRRFRRLAKEHHPDRLAQASEHERESAQRRFVLLQQAYQQVVRGWPKGHS